MSYNYYNNRQPRDVSVPNGYGAMPASRQSYHNTTHPTSRGAPHQGHRTTAVYPPLHSHTPVHTAPNRSHTHGSSTPHRSFSRNEPSTALVPYNPAVAARHEPPSNATPSPNHARNPSSATVHHTMQPSTSSHRSSSRNEPSTALVPYNPIVAARNRANSNVAPPKSHPPNQARNHSSTAPLHTGRPSTASNGQNSIPFPRLGERVAYNGERNQPRPSTASSGSPRY
ncbi:hypothetical protein IW261DRAFT_735243 [Armillaria novae-zelandiae]|uniref:Uncharacterized protein n=1 Tax=Armillaria novae-zelandiae TaxID=153914 RepID=A0AA39NVF0_9AGAR|nr:hypothetical protein IW261DRAFT_735243 [Armillaria novae-zelandiae]